MRVLLDECLPRKLGRLIIGHQVTTVPQGGLAGLKNGALLASASGRFEVLITIDQSIPDQQNLLAAKIGVVMLAAVSNRMEHLAPLVPQILAVLPTVVAGQIYRISAASP
jgi:predicted nuclease of predicted toxin-antitoxin system